MKEILPMDNVFKRWLQVNRFSHYRCLICLRLYDVSYGVLIRAPPLGKRDALKQMSHAPFILFQKKRADQIDSFVWELLGSNQ
jgi:hypothetical protein